ncbi:MAG TPA: SDR family NAD(P)-dependent oxidoreductase [Thiolapillus brandeum]|uniref:SDR family NAD(P)-dependent oxidoreductase n=1 Tax=Thiolapillus brandeum TaxID=1076588 RepID=A0A7C5IYW0_9GAMM|nr:SDR family NAD(P)-dependent oxidoreductase [Thiolapillus brandeum]
MSETKTIVITGVTKGLGRALAEAWLRAGHRVWGCGRSRQAIEALQEQWPQARFAVVDVADWEAVRAWAEDCLAGGEAPDLIVNNAALINANAPLWQVPVAEFHAVIEVNVNGVYHVVKAFLPAMLARRQGVIVNFSSGWGRSTAPEVAPYCASKWAVEGLTRSLAQELPAGMAAIPLNPGIIHTEMLDSCFGAMAGHYPDPATWAETAAPFILRLGPQHNGQPLTVPGF